MGRYFGPDFDWRKQKSLNSVTGTHALGTRARKLGEGILITRFELPFNIWCGEREGEGCGKHIGQGVRFNAEKKRVGAYFSTPIFEFRCKVRRRFVGRADGQCHECAENWFTIRTDPQVRLSSGARAHPTEHALCRRLGRAAEVRGLGSGGERSGAGARVRRTGGGDRSARGDREGQVEQDRGADGRATARRDARRQ